jgi:hypothetical protein
MTPEQRNEIIRLARQDARALRSGWSVPGRKFNTQDEAQLWKEEFDKALQEGRL